MPRPLTGTSSDRAKLFHALSDDTRLAVIEMLRGGERCVCELQDSLDAAQSRLSFHLRVLKDAGLVEDRKVGRWSYYSMTASRLDDVVAYVDSMRPAPKRPLLTRSSSGSPRLVALGRRSG
ncbi:MAG: metalloregulator ArsR/SmtB family transcription factor [Gemmatimonadota bacterium]|nr:metalloregulator ArsR/SmtB family transcription factor [Gemmatimonadota bacterium]